MDNGPTVCTFHTISGPVRITTMRDFTGYVKRKMINTPTIEYCTPSGPLMGALVGAESIPIPEMEVAYERKTVKPKVFHKITSQEVLSKNVHQIKEMLEMQIKAFIQQQLKTYIVKRDPDFTVKDLDTEALEKLSEKYCENLGCSYELFGFPVYLSPYQRYFVFVDTDAFEFIMSEFENCMSNMCHEYRGELVEMHSQKWVLGRYSELTYLKEMNEKTRYGPYK